MEQHLKYVVASAHEAKFDVEAEVAGKKMMASVPGVVIELVSEDGAMGHTFRFVPDGIAATLEAFAVGTKVTMTLIPAAD